MACGVPWVSTEWGVVAESPPEECGLVVPSHDPERMARAIGELLRDPVRRNCMGKRARERAVAGYSERQYVRRTSKCSLHISDRARYTSPWTPRGSEPVTRLPMAQPIGLER